jgi:hypothetical protein
MADLDLTPTFAERLADPKMLAAILLGVFGLGVVVGFKLLGSAPAPDFYQDAYVDPVNQVFEQHIDTTEE